jgi:hypothetical protein
MTGSGRNESCSKGPASGQPIARTAALRVATAGRTTSADAPLIRPAIGKGELGCNLPAAGRDKAAAEPDQTVDRKRHVLVVCADGADIVTIVPDGRSQGASLQTKAFDKAATDIAMAPVPLQHAHL